MRMLMTLSSVPTSTCGMTGALEPGGPDRTGAGAAFVTGAEGRPGAAAGTSASPACAVAVMVCCCGLGLGIYLPLRFFDFGMVGCPLECYFARGWAF